MKAHWGKDEQILKQATRVTVQRLSQSSTSFANQLGLWTGVTDLLQMDSQPPVS